MKNFYHGVLETDTEKSGFQRSDIIKVETKEGIDIYRHISRGSYGEVTDQSGNVVLNSVLEGKFYRKIIGTADIVFYNNELEVFRVVLITDTKYPQIKYKNLTYDYIKVKTKLLEEFSTDEFLVKLDLKKHKIEFSYKEGYLYECIACALDIWRCYWNF